MDRLPAVVGDVFDRPSVPEGLLAGEALKALFNKRADSARDVMLNELSHGKVRLSETDAEVAAAIVYRFLRAAQDGAARVDF